MDVARLGPIHGSGSKRIRLPNDARLALWVCPNVEHYEFLPDPGKTRNPWPRTPHPDILGYSLRDYGNRVGLWRMLEVLDEYRVPCTASLNAAVFAHYPEILDACEKRNWDYMLHGMYNTRYLWNLSEEDERDAIWQSLRLFEKFTGRQPAGWFSPSVSHTLRTPDLVAEAGFQYYCDFYHDDQPTPIRVRNGTLVSLPYQMDLNDAVLFARSCEGDDFLRVARDMFDTLYAEGAEACRVMNMAIHPYISGRPQRIRFLDKALDYILSHSGVWLATGAELTNWYRDSLLRGGDEEDNNVDQT
ncbi:polysaccharide deacetylase family protein [Bradyrhizobium diversitatis]|nr:polysaccharide deacetylase family protein [Bradyrhizobium diversitatis]